MEWRGTLDGRYAEKVAEFQARRRAAASADDLRRVEDEETAYLLDAVPFIREYAHECGAHEGGGGGLKPTKSAGALEGFVEVKHAANRNNVLQRYLMHVEKRVDNTTVAAAAAHDAPPAQHAEYSCPHCDDPMLLDAREATLVCASCGLCRPHTEMTAANLTYEQEIHQDVVTHFAYKRLNHFCEWLNSVQAKENTEIPQDVIDAVKAEFKKARVATRADIKPAKVREFLKKLKLNKVRESQLGSQ